MVMGWSLRLKPLHPAGLITTNMHAEDRVTTTLADVKAYCLGHWNSLAIGDGILRNVEGFGLGVGLACGNGLRRRSPMNISVLRLSH